MAEKTFSEMMHEQWAAEQAKRAQEREQQRNEFLNGLRSELEGYQKTALETAKTRELGNLRAQFNSGLLNEEQKAEVQEKILNPSLITTTATAVTSPSPAARSVPAAARAVRASAAEYMAREKASPFPAMHS